MSAPLPSPNEWQEYQPERRRDKDWYDIELKDGTIVIGCWPNGVHWNHPDHRPIADYRVKRIRLTEDWVKSVWERNEPSLQKPNLMRIRPLSACPDADNAV